MRKKYQAKKSLGKKILGNQKYWAKTLFREIIVGQKKLSGKKIDIWAKINFGAKRNIRQKNFRQKKLSGKKTN